MNMKFDPDFRTSLSKKSKVQIRLFEPKSPYYSWHLESWGDCKGEFLPEYDVDVEKVLDKGINNKIYNKLNDYYLIPGTSFLLPK